jgi:uncharacterized membrane protein SpoIIM required for sporulation
MTPEQLIRQRQAQWETLSGLLNKADRAPTALSQVEVEAIGRIYRDTTSDLALAQRDFPQHDVARYLNQLVARAHANVYRSDPLSLRQIRRFFTHLIPQTFRATWRFFAVASLLFWLPALVTGLLVAHDSDVANLVLSSQYAPVVQDIEDNTPWFYFDGDDQPAASAFITTNNVRVSIMAFAGGMTAGIFTFYVVIFNGLMVGGLFGLAYFHDFYHLFNFAVGHGVIELNMICLAGAAGLVFTWAILRPGYRTRSDALRVAGRQALILVMTCAIFLVVAGLIEGFISPREDLNPVVKWIVGFGSGSLMFAYLLGGGRHE